ncbi:MAG: addiction module toxin RelE [Bacteroidales bacterium]|nr:addiction module toxin RelE [Bacteroidales bacterium]
MDVLYIPTSEFVLEVKRLGKKYRSLKEDLSKFRDDYASGANVGVDLGGGYRKVRISIKSKNKGKSGGARVITYDLGLKEVAIEGDNGEIRRQVILITIYDKGEIDSIGESEYKNILKAFISN